MVYPIYTPRLNNNDDEVRLSALFVRPGDEVTIGKELAEVETDKANFAIEADRDGYILRIPPKVGDIIAVGSVLLWLGDQAGETVPSLSEPRTSSESASAGPANMITAKAKILMEEHHLDPSTIPKSGERLTVKDVEEYLSSLGGPSEETGTTTAKVGDLPVGFASGHTVALSPAERGMMRSVLWHRDEAAVAYLEIEYDSEPWEQFASRYAERNRLLSSPQLAIMMHQLAGIAATHPKLNSTILADKHHIYDHVNLGFTIQADDTLYLPVIHDAANTDRAVFLREFNRLHKLALGRRLTPNDLQGATVAFTSMARWQVRRHIPIIPPFVSLMCAHSRGSGTVAVLGASYDHRVLTGADTQAVLHRLAIPPSD